MPQDRKQSGRILVVDDEKALAEVIATILRKDGYDVSESYDPLEALAICKSSDSIDVVLLDFQMPHLNGLELAQGIRSFRPRIKIVFMSANLQICEQLIADNETCLKKPFEFENLKTTIRATLENSRTQFSV